MVGHSKTPHSVDIGPDQWTFVVVVVVVVVFVAGNSWIVAVASGLATIHESTIVAFLQSANYIPASRSKSSMATVWRAQDNQIDCFGNKKAPPSQFEHRAWIVIWSVGLVRKRDHQQWSNWPQVPRETQTDPSSQIDRKKCRRQCRERDFHNYNSSSKAAKSHHLRTQNQLFVVVYSC